MLSMHYRIWLKQFASVLISLSRTNNKMVLFQPTLGNNKIPLFEGCSTPIKKKTNSMLLSPLVLETNFITRELKIVF